MLLYGSRDMYGEPVEMGNEIADLAINNTNRKPTYTNFVWLCIVVCHTVYSDKTKIPQMISKESSSETFESLQILTRKDISHFVQMTNIIVDASALKKSIQKSP